MSYYSFAFCDFRAAVYQSKIGANKQQSQTEKAKPAQSLENWRVSGVPSTEA
jgi:hypothetical protein